MSLDSDAIENPYEMLGGEEAIRRLVKRFYEIMRERKEAQHIRAMHPQNMRVSEEKLFMFLSGWLGGPQLYVERFGHPRMRMRHLPFAIGRAEADAWMLCMRQALDETFEPSKTRDSIERAFARLADHMRNQPEE